MYVIISHDVDHLFGRDHWFRDLSYPKLWVRSTLQLIQKKISVKEWVFRCLSCFRHKRHNIEEVMHFDRENGVPSTFFFAMNQGLGLSYKPKEAKNTILKVHNAGFDVGVHGISYDTKKGIEVEYKRFIETTGMEPCGIRMHYVRFNNNTFEYESQVGYRFDSTEFNKKENGTRKDPYSVGGMWEFPLCIMDGYLPENYRLMQETTIQLLKECEEKHLKYITILFHDCYFSKEYRDLFRWYRWMISWLSDKKEYAFISFSQAVKLLEEERYTKA